MKNLILLYGTEKLLIKESISIIKQRLVPDYLDAVNFIALDGKSVLEEEIINVCHIVPMMNTKKLVVVYDARFFLSGKTGQEEGPMKQELFLKQLESIPDYTYLVFTVEKPDKRKKIYKLINLKGTVKEFKTLSLKDKAFWIKERLGKYGKEIDLKTAYFIAEYTDDLFQTDNELKKLSSFVGERQKIQKEDIEGVLYKSLEGNIFDMMDCIGMKNTIGAVNIINGLLKQGEKGVVILFMISKHIMNLLTVKSLHNITFEDLKEKSGLHPFVIRKAVNQAKNFTEDELKRSLRLCQELDIDIKKGKIEEKTGLELLVTSIS